MAEEDGHVEGHYSTGRREHQMSKLFKGSSSSNATSNESSSTNSTGHGILDIFRERFSRNRRPHSKERPGSDHRESGNRQSDSGASNSPSANAEREAAAIAVLENVIDSYNPRSSIGSGKETSGNSGSSKVSFQLFNLKNSSK